MKCYECGNPLTEKEAREADGFMGLRIVHHACIEDYNKRTQEFDDFTEW